MFRSFMSPNFGLANKSVNIKIPLGVQYQEAMFLLLLS
jgi:hypothetical protein